MGTVVRRKYPSIVRIEKLQLFERLSPQDHRGPIKRPLLYIYIYFYYYLNNTSYKYEEDYTTLVYEKRRKLPRKWRRTVDIRFRSVHF